jgi:hypothetical protein
MKYTGWCQNDFNIKGYTQEMLRRGILSSGTFCCPTYAHKPQHVDVYLQACGEVFHLLAAWLKDAGGDANSPQLHARLEGGLAGPTMRQAMAR